MSAPLIFLSIEVAAIVCAALVAAGVLAREPRRPAAWLVALIAGSVACSVLLSHQEFGYRAPAAFRFDVGAWAPALNLGRNLVPGLLMLLCHSLFAERRRFPAWLLALLAVQLLLEEPGRALVPSGWTYGRLVTQTAPALLQTLFVGWALYWTVADWRADLVERRRRARALMLVAMSLLTVASLLLGRVLLATDDRAGFIVHVAVTLCDVAILVFVLVQLMRGELSLLMAVGGGRRPAPEARASGADREAEAALARLTALLETQQVCQEPGLSLQGLADRVGLPVYRLRRLIHERLGYQNFNALLHDYRVRAACAQLSDPRLRRTPILTIALSVGYSSVNTFNRGFRDIMRVTPSAYRALQLSGGGETTPEAE